MPTVALQSPSHAEDVYVAAPADVPYDPAAHAFAVANMDPFGHQYPACAHGTMELIEEHADPEGQTPPALELDPSGQ